METPRLYLLYVRCTDCRAIVKREEVKPDAPCPACTAPTPAWIDWDPRTHEKMPLGELLVELLESLGVYELPVDEHGRLSPLAADVYAYLWCDEDYVPLTTDRQPLGVAMATETPSTLPLAEDEDGDGEDSEVD